MKLLGILVFLTFSANALSQDNALSLEELLEMVESEKLSRVQPVCEDELNEYIVEFEYFQSDEISTNNIYLNPEFQLLSKSCGYFEEDDGRESYIEPKQLDDYVLIDLDYDVRDANIVLRIYPNNVGTVYSLGLEGSKLLGAVQLIRKY